MKRLKYLQLFEDRLESLRKLVELGLADPDTLMVLDYMAGPMTDSLYLEDSAIETLPDGLRVGGGLYLSGSQIKTLPDDLAIAGDLDLEDTTIETLPARLWVIGDLFLSQSAIKSLPDDLSVGGKIYGFRG